MTRSSRTNSLTQSSAVSPVIGTILMVAITVILAAIIAVSTFGFLPNDLNNNMRLGIYAKRIGQDVQVTISRLDARNNLDALEVSIDGVYQGWTAAKTVGSTETYANVPSNAQIIVIASFSEGGPTVIFDDRL